MKLEKTNAMRLLDAAHLQYEVKEYPHNNEALDGVSVARLLEQDPEQVFKTLVTVSNKKEYFVFMVPVKEELDLKKAAKLVHAKSIDMIPVKEIPKVTGYIRGSTCPLAMKKKYPTFIHETAILYDTIMFSGGKLGYQILMNPEELMNLEQIEAYDIIKS
ncbi:MAG: Cys-tRNA(Pro) deacylase [Bacillota bacterium]|nr:Cys-tRNA(Pro) deacylase [Bacillota bacterium]